MMYCWTQRPNPIAAAAIASAKTDRERFQFSSARVATAPATSVITTSALPLRLHSTSEGGPRITNAVDTQAIERENNVSISTNCRQTNNTKHASVTAFSATTPSPVTENSA